MNPILLKPIEGKMRVHIDGEKVAQEGWKDYKRRTPELALLVDSRLRELISSHQAEVALVEGAGSCVELNLAHQDLGNLALMDRHQSDWILVGDIDRGGIYAQILGVRECLSAQTWNRCRGVVINRLRGDAEFFKDGQEDIAERISKPVHVVPHLESHGLPDEDGYSITRQSTRGDGPHLACAVHLPHLAMSDDLEAVASDPLWSVQWHREPPVDRPDAVILPGSTDSLSDAKTLMAGPWPRKLRSWAAEGIPIVGICGGYHILGEEIHDPKATDGQGGTQVGLGLLPVSTTMASQKIIRPLLGDLEGTAFQGYEIHHGRSERKGGAPLLSGGEDQGCRLGSVVGCHVHGLLNNAEVRKSVLGHGAQGVGGDALDRWADHLSRHGVSALELLGRT